MLNRHVGRRTARLFLFLLWPPILASAAEREAGCACLAVEDVAKGSAAESSGLHPGDVITASSFEGPAGAPVETRLCSPFALMQIPIERARRGVVALSGRRAGQPWRVEVAAGLEGLRVGSCADAPALPETASWERLQFARARSEARDWTEADKAFGAALEDLGADAVPAWRAQVLRVWGDSLAIRNDAVDADRRYQEALAEDRRGEPGLAAARDLHLLGALARERGALDKGDAYLREALALQQRLASGSLDEAATLDELGALETSRGTVDVAETHLQQAFAIQDTLAPEGVELARTLYLLGQTFVFRDVPRAEQYKRRALAIQERLAPRSQDMANTVNGLGIIAGMKGDIRGAADHFRRALALREALRPGDPRIDTHLSNLGTCAELEGDLAAAEDYYRRALAGAERQNPESPRASLLRRNLGALARARGDLETADAELRRALAISEKLAPRGLDTRLDLSALAEVALARGDGEAARELLQRAVDIDAEQAPDGLPMANDRILLCKARRLLGDAAGAEADAQRALQIVEAQSPGGTDAAEVLGVLGELATDRQELAKALDYQTRTLAIYRRVAPGSAGEAQAQHELGRVYAKLDQAPQALESFCAAIDSVESQGARIGGTEAARVSFRARYAGYYHDCLVALVRAGRPDEAVQVLERSRARELLALLAERDVAFSADLPPELVRERRMADVGYDRAQAALAQAGPKTDPAELAGLRAGEREARARQDDVAARARKASPRFASLQYPSPLALPDVRAALDPGTVLLSYSVGRDETILLAVESAASGSGGLRAHRLPIGDAALRGRIEAFRRAIQAPRSTKAALMAQAAELYDILIAPAEERVAASARVLILPDGPLHSLPFSALVRRSSGAGGDRHGRASFLVEWKPLHIVPSATVYAEVRKSRRDVPVTEARLVAFGDPRYPPLSAEDVAASADVREVERSFRLTPLPYTRREVDAIARYFPARTEKHLGADATEERVKALDKGARYVHLACHGYLDQRFPLNSALALTIRPSPREDEDNGLLQVWEIFDKVRLDADLVALSACDTALGTEMGGEGLLGLTRAFLYAGARSVLGTLWGISDRASPLLLERFYGHLREGKSRDAALQAAQVDFIQGRVRGHGAVDLSHPFRWAAFQLSGDWR